MLVLCPWQGTASRQPGCPTVSFAWSFPFRRRISATRRWAFFLLVRCWNLQVIQVHQAWWIFNIFQWCIWCSWISDDIWWYLVVELELSGSKANTLMKLSSRDLDEDVSPTSRPCALANAALEVLGSIGGKEIWWIMMNYAQMSHFQITARIWNLNRVTCAFSISLLLGPQAAKPGHWGGWVALVLRKAVIFACPCWKWDPVCDDHVRLYKRYGRADGGPFYISDLVGNSTLYKFANFRFVNLGRVESGEERWDVVQAPIGTRWISLTWEFHSVQELMSLWSVSRRCSLNRGSLPQFCPKMCSFRKTLNSPPFPKHWPNWV